MFDSHKLARIVLEIGAIQIRPDNPFTWASGYQMPVYNDNRLLLGRAEHRMLVAEGFQAILQNRNIPVDVVAGTATAGIPHATTLANLLQAPLVYVRDRPKDHGRQNQVEGVMKENQNVILVEDLVSTGTSSLRALRGLREARGRVHHCLCIFHYGFPEAAEAFAKAQCALHSLLTFESLLTLAQETGTLSRKQMDVVRPWSHSPFSWGEQHGFPRKKV